MLDVDKLSIRFTTDGVTSTPVDHVSFQLKSGRTLAVVGESGSGKSVTSLSIMRLLPTSGHIAGGRILYRARNGRELDLAEAPPAVMRRVRGRDIAMIFQEPMTSLNPLFTAGDQIAEMILLHERIGRSGARARAKRMLELVEIPAAARRLDDYPHQMSGGMRQRVMIALALACSPSVLIADEPTTALDVTIQAQILDLLRRLQRELGMSILFVTHNLGVVAEIAHDVLVMYAGQVVERAPASALFRRPKHPYTRALLACIPNMRRDRPDEGPPRRLPAIPGQVPDSRQAAPGCQFAPRCGFRIDACVGEVPPLFQLDNRASRCIRNAEL